MNPIAAVLDAYRTKARVNRRLQELSRDEAPPTPHTVGDCACCQLMAEAHRTPAVVAAWRRHVLVDHRRLA